MGFYSIYKILKDIFRTIFGNKALKLIFIILIFILILMFLNNKGVFAESQYSFSTTYFTEQDINNARTRLGDSIWNNENYDIFLGYRPEWNNKAVFVVNANNLQYLGEGINYYFQISSSTGLGVLSARNSSNTVITPTSQYPSQYIEQCLADGRRDTANLNQYWLCRGTMSNNTINILPIRCRYNIYELNTNNLIFRANYNNFQEPYFITSETDIQNWNFDFLEISGGDVPYYTAFPGGSLEDQTTYIELNLIYNYVNYEIDVSQFITIDEDTAYWSIKIPKNYLFNFVNVQNSIDFKFSLFVEQQNPFEQWTIDTNTMSFNLTAEQLSEINSDTNKQIQGTIVSQQQEIIQGQQDLNNSINNSEIEDISDNTLPSDSTTDITADGVNGIFTSIYNAFCTGQAQDIVFPIPFTDKSITLSPNYISNALTNSGATFIITIIQAFWWYIISRFIIKDVMNKINKIKSGNIEDIETNNIRGDML